MTDQIAAPKLNPALFSFDVFGTLIDIREGSYAAFQSILEDSGRPNVDIKAFWEHWEHRNIAHYVEPYRRYREICELSLAEAFSHFRINGDPRLIARYFESFQSLPLFSDVNRTLDILSNRGKIAIVSNIDDDLLGLTQLGRTFDLVCTAQRAVGYKPDGTLFRYLIDHAGVPKSAILHSGQSQFTDMVGAKPLGLTVAWINRRGVLLDKSVPRPDFTVPDIQSLIPLLQDTP